MDQEIVTEMISSLAFGGRGILRCNGEVVFVPFTAPGDKIRCRILVRKKKFAEGAVEDLLEPSPLRTAPPCEYFGICGGCQLQHLGYQDQLAYKQEAVKDSLQRIGKLDCDVLPIVGSQQTLFYRRHVTLHIRAAKQRYEIGYIGQDNKAFLQISHCPIFEPCESPVFASLRGILANLEFVEGNEGRAKIIKASEGRYLLHLQWEAIPKNCKSILQKALQGGIWEGAIIGDRSNEFHLGNTKASETIAGMRISFSPKSFMQNHPAQSLAIYQDICDQAGILNIRRIMDLYCGIGISSILLAKLGANVEGIECNAEAIACAKENAACNGLKNISFKQADVNKQRDALFQKKPELVIVNPPRIGLDPSVIQLLLRNSPEWIFYISCMPPTLARDLSHLCQEKYTAAYCRPYDMFPQTSHVETFVILKRK